MTAILEHLDWDSEFFGHDVFRLRVSDHADLALLDNVQSPALVYIFSNLRLNENLNGRKAQLVDTKVTFEQAIFPSLASLHYEGIRSLRGKKPTTILRQLALDSGQYSRYAVDPRISRHRFEKLYDLWLENSLNGLIADEVIGCFDQQENLQGFCTIKVHQKQASIGLISVNADSRGMGIGRRMIDFTRSYTARAGISRLSVVTQATNEQAFRFYQGTGFSVAEQLHIYHAWID